MTSWGSWLRIPEDLFLPPIRLANGSMTVLDVSGMLVAAPIPGFFDAALESGQS